MLALLRHGGTKEKATGNRPFAQHLVTRDLPGLQDANWATLEALCSATHILHAQRLLGFIVFREEEGLQAGDRVARHFVLGELGMDGSLKVFLGALGKDQWYRSVEDAERARLPHLVIRAGIDEAPMRVRVSGSDFAALAEHLAPAANSPWSPMLGRLADDGFSHQLDWVHKVTNERLHGQVPIL